MTRSCKQSARVAALLVVLAMCNATYSHAQETARSKALAQKMMCVCGCNQILGACNHVGCTYSHDMIKEVEARVARNEPDDLTLQAFVQEYGPSVLIEPPAKGFNLTAWIMPVVVPMISLVILWEVVRRWRQRAAVATASGPRVSPELLARARQEAGKDE